MFQVTRPRIPRFAKWAKINKPFTKPKHYIGPDDKSIIFSVKNGDIYANHIEMSSFYVSGIISYGCKQSGELIMMRHIVFPTLRCYPNNTSGSLDCNFKGVKINVDGTKSKELTTDFIFDGTLSIKTKIDKLHIQRQLFPATNHKCFIEQIKLSNKGNNSININIQNLDKDKLTPARFGANRERYQLKTFISDCSINLNAGESKIINVAY